MLPFFWQHGEDEATLREYVNAIHDANCMAFCVESRPHPDFCGPKWWQDMDVILDEAKKLGMKVWILDDSHFPTGFANGALKDAPQEVCRQSIFCKFLSYEGDAREVVFRTEKLAKPPKYKLSFIQKMMMSGSTKDARKYDDDQVYSITAYGPKGEEIDLSGSTTWKKPAGTWQVAVCGLSRNLGPHRAYINMMNEVSCHKLIEAVYEPHFDIMEIFLAIRSRDFSRMSRNWEMVFCMQSTMCWEPSRICLGVRNWRNACKKPWA